MKPSYLILSLFFLLNFQLYSQESEIDRWTIGAGLSNFVMHGDLTSKSPNRGYYIYANRMITPIFGFELKGQILNMEGESQDINDFTTDNLRFEGDALGGELNLIVNISELGRNKKKSKFNLASYFGIGYHTYDSKLFNDLTNELIADFSDENPFKSDNAKSVFFSSALGLKYKISNKLDIELRQSINFNNEDHLDALVNDKQQFETFFITQIGVAFNLGKGKIENKIPENTIVKNTIKVKKKPKKLQLDLTDTDNDGVIDLFDKEANTDPRAMVYANGVAIDSDKDGTPDHLDKCPLIFGKGKDGCFLTEENISITKEITQPIITKTKPKEIIKTPTKKEIVIAIPKTTVTKQTITKPKVVKPKVEIPKTITSNSTNDNNEKTLVENIITNAKKAEKPKKVKNLIAVNEATKVKYESNPNYNKVKEINKNSIKHNVFELDNSVSLSKIEVSPVFPGCDNYTDNEKIQNCLIFKIYNYSLDNFNTSNLKNLQLKKGTNLVRVIFVVDDSGKSKAFRVLGRWDSLVIKEATNLIDSMPIMKPGLLNNIPTPVKISVELPFKM
jgi:hypothetical protein